MEQRVVKLAVLDLYDNTPNQGMRAIRQIIESFGATLDYQVFDVRAKGELPGLDFELYISSGGPGSPLDGDGVWDKAYFELIDSIFAWMSFGTFKVHQTPEGRRDVIFKDLPDPFFVADFRHWQFIQPREDRFAELGARILALEKIRPHIDLERAVMAIRFSPEIFGTQFHPEADRDGMLLHFLKEENKTKVIETHGHDKYNKMIRDLNNPKKIKLTNETVLPTFISQAIEATVRAVVNV